MPSSWTTESIQDFLRSWVKRPAEVDQSPTLLGILDHDTTGFDQNHSFVMRLPTEWLDSAKAKFQLTVELAKGIMAWNFGLGFFGKKTGADKFQCGQTERVESIRTQASDISVEGC